MNKYKTKTIEENIAIAHEMIDKIRALLKKIVKKLHDNKPKHR